MTKANTEIDCNITEWRDNWAKEIKDAISTIEALSTKLAEANMKRSSAHYNGGWIPVEERLPEVRRNCLVSVKYSGFMGMHGMWVKT